MIPLIMTDNSVSKMPTAHTAHFLLVTSRPKEWPSGHEIFIMQAVLPATLWEMPSSRSVACTVKMQYNVSGHIIGATSKLTLKRPSYFSDYYDHDCVRVLYIYFALHLSII